MGRKSLAKERTGQILDAFEACIVEFGLSGATLQRVADHAKMKLSMIDHYIGKREALVEMMIARFLKRYQEDNALFLAELSAENRLHNLLTFYFSESSVNYRPKDSIILTELMTIAERDETVKQHLKSLFKFIEQTFLLELQTTYPSAESSECERTAYLILSLWYGNATMQWLGFEDRGGLVLKSAEILIAQLQKGATNESL